MTSWQSMDQKGVELIDQETGFFIAGNRKNAGKTTALNYLCSRIQNKKTAMLFTIGWDGEQSDLIFGNRKPLIPVKEGTCFLTADPAISGAGIPLKILCTMPFTSSAGRYYFVQALDSGNIELIGPESNEQVHYAVKIGREMINGVFIIDGALDRVSHLSSLAGSFAFVFSPSEDYSHEAVRNQFRKWVHHFTLPQQEIMSFPETGYMHIDENGLTRKLTMDELSGPDSGLICFSGAVTDRKVSLINRNVRIVARDFTHIFAESELKKRDFSVHAKICPSLIFASPGHCGIIRNTDLIEIMKQEMAKKALSVPLINALELTP